MSCKSCGTEETIRAHLIPKTIATEVNEGQAHAAGVVDGETFEHSQSGFWDPDILCARCDNKIGDWEEYASNVLERIREKAAHKPLGKHRISADGNKLIRCFLAVLWKYSVADERFGGGLSLGPYQDICYRIAFKEKEIPERIDAFIFRLKVSENDNGVFAYRAPLPDSVPDPETGDSINLQRMMMGGCLIFVRLDRRRLNDNQIEECLIRDKKEFEFITKPAQFFEEYRELSQSASGDTPLSNFLDQRGQ